MSAHVPHSLFPDGHELHTAALEALRQLEIDRALGLVQRAMAIDARLVDADYLLAALRWLLRQAPNCSCCWRAGRCRCGSIRAASISGARRTRICAPASSSCAPEAMSRVRRASCY